MSADLKWSTHISNICKRVGSTFGFLMQNLQNCPQEHRCLAYIALIRSSLEYSATVWDSYLKQEVDPLATVHCQDYRSRETGYMWHMFQELNLSPLQKSLKQQWLTTYYKTDVGHIQAMPPWNFPMSADRNCGRIHPTTLRIGTQTTPLPDMKSKTPVA